MNWTHVSVIVQCQSDGRSLSCKYGAVVWQSFAQLAAGCLNILEMVVDDRRCPHSVVYFGAIRENFIMLALCFTILIELSLGFLWGDHTFAYSSNEVVLLWDRNCALLVENWVSPEGRPIRHGSLLKPRLPLHCYQRQGSGFGSCILSYLAGGHADLSWFSQINAGHGVLGCVCRHAFSENNAWISLTEFHWPQCTGWRLGW